MQEIHSQSERLSQQLNQVGASALANMMAALVRLSNRDKKSNDKKLTVTREISETPDLESATVSRTNSPEATMDSGFKVTHKDSINPDLSPQQQAERSIEQLNGLLANRQYFQRDLDVNGSKYNFQKYRGGGIDIRSKDSKLFAKQGKIRFAGDELKLIKDLPEIVARVERELDLERPKQINNRTEVLYGYNSNNNFIELNVNTGAYLIKVHVDNIDFIDQVLIQKENYYYNNAQIVNIIQVDCGLTPVVVILFSVKSWKML